MPNLFSPGIVRLKTIFAFLLAIGATAVTCRALADSPPASDGETGAWENNVANPRDPWYIRTEALALHREYLAGDWYASEGPSTSGTSTVALDHSDLYNPFEGGGRLVVGHTFEDSPFQIEASWFGINTLDTADRVFDPTGMLFSPFTNFGQPPNGNVDFATGVTVRDVSRLESGEINLKCLVPLPVGCPTTSVLFGVKHVGVREEFDYFSEPAPIAFVHTHTNNNLWGPQIGAQVEFGRPCEWFRIEGTFGICNNSADRDFEANIGGVDAMHPRLQQSGTADVGDIKASIIWRPTSMLTINVGYEALWCDQLVLASRNFSYDVATLQTAGAEPVLNRRGTVIYDGPFAGLQFNW